jgi:hypothetical protein
MADRDRQSIWRRAAEEELNHSPLLHKEGPGVDGGHGFR